MTPDHAEPVELTITTTEFEAETIVQALRHQGIVAASMGGALAGFRADTPTFVRVMVPRAQLAHARSALRAIKADSVDIDWDQIDVGDPEPQPPRTSSARHPCRCRT